MKKLTVKKIVNQGNVNFEFYLNEEKIEAGYMDSRRLTETTSESGKGVFEPGKDKIGFSFGTRDAVINVCILGKKSTAAEFLTEILDRIKKVRAWVEYAKNLDSIESGEATGDIEPTIAELIAEIENLKTEKAKRDKTGKFCK